MNMVKKSCLLAVVSCFCLSLLPGVVFSAEYKVGFVSIQKVLFGSKAGIAAGEKLRDKEESVRAEFMVDAKAAEQLSVEIQKKQSVWSADKLAEKQREFKKMERDLKMKEDDAKYEIVEMRKRMLNPILAQLDPVLKEYGTTNGFSMIIDADVASRSGLIVFGDPSLDVSKDLVNKLNEKM